MASSWVKPSCAAWLRMSSEAWTAADPDNMNTSPGTYQCAAIWSSTSLGITYQYAASWSTALGLVLTVFVMIASYGNDNAICPLAELGTRNLGSVHFVVTTCFPRMDLVVLSPAFYSSRW